jgi:hypothetical protein
MTTRNRSNRHHTITVLPEAHAYDEPAIGPKRCAACGRKRSYGVHRNVPKHLVRLPHAKHEHGYRTSGKPLTALNRIWTTLYTTGR